jgi:hypothetical protein
MYTAMPDSHNLHSTIAQKLLKYTNLKEELFRICRLPTTGVIPNKLHESLKPLNLLPALYIVIQKAAALNTCRTVINFWQNRVTSAWSVRRVLF